MFSSGRAISSLTRPPASSTRIDPLTYGRLNAPLTSCSRSSASSGPTKPTMNWRSKPSVSPSTKTTRSPVVADNDRHIASPFPSTSPKLGISSDSSLTTAPAAAASCPVPSVESASITTTSSMAPTSRSATHSLTTASIVSATCLAGITTLIRGRPSEAGALNSYAANEFVAAQDWARSRATRCPSDAFSCSPSC